MVTIKDNVDIVHSNVSKPKSTKKFRLMLVIIATALLLLTVAAVYLYRQYFPNSALLHNNSIVMEKKEAFRLIFFPLPDMIVNIQADGGRVAYLKLQLSLQYTNAGMTALITQLTPRIIDDFQAYLRELRISDLGGSAGLIHLKEELLIRVNQLFTGQKIDDVLFEQILVE